MAHHNTLQGLFRKEVGTLAVLFAFFALTIFCRISEFRDIQSWYGVLPASFVFTAIYFFLYRLLLRVSVWHLSLVWLSIPYFIFAFGWLQVYWAIVCVIVWCIALYRTMRAEKNTGLTINGSRLAGLLLVLVWVYLSGAGGHGNQSPDYNMHNGRLLDLINEPWPVHFTEGYWATHPEYGPGHTYLVGYTAYYLPSAWIGKWLGYDRALECMHVWTLAGCWLALAWLWKLSGARTGLMAAVLMIAFGGWDIAGVCIELLRGPHGDSWQHVWAALREYMSHASEDTGSLDFWPVGQFRYFFGNFLSNSSEIFWSPHQTIAAWVVSALLLQAFLSGGLRYVFFVYALIVYWSPMNMVTTALFPLALVLHRGAAGIREALSFENTLAAGAIMLVFGLYYLSGSSLVNPAGWLWQKTDLSLVWWVFPVFHLLAWGIYALIVAVGWKLLPAEKLFFLVLCSSFLFLSLVSYGQYNDLLCRGATALMFAMLLLVQRRIHALSEQRKFIAVLCVCLLLLPGTVSCLQHIQRSILYRDQQVKPQSVSDYRDGWEFLGSADSIFFRFLARNPSADSHVKAVE
ncbi:MAG TPA: hypothetical protein PLF22_06190 [Pseudomonadales bacterium]|nr:hypothetical protein [Pseudomonadales bacterium]